VPKVLNVGGNSKEIELPVQYTGWEHILLDIDERVKPDIACDARHLTKLPAAEYDAVYCSHNLEHYYPHDVKLVLQGFHHVLKEDGFIHVLVPDIGELIKIVAKNNLDIDDVLYQSSAGPITVKDVIYGFGKEIESSGNDFFAHKTGFTQKSLGQVISNAGFPYMFLGPGSLEIHVIAFKHAPGDDARQLFGLTPPV